jgi:hypothetical protein
MDLCGEQLPLRFSFFPSLQTELRRPVGRSVAIKTMTNWHDPAVEAAEGRSSSSLSDKPSYLSFPEVALIKLIHAAAGVYM